MWSKSPETVPVVNEWLNIRICVIRVFVTARRCTFAASPWSRSSKDLSQRAWEDPTFVSRIIISNESWVYRCDPDQTAVFTAEKSTLTKTVHQVKSAIESMLIFSFDICWVVHHEFVQGQFYYPALRNLWEEILRKQLELWCNSNWVPEKIILTTSKD